MNDRDDGVPKSVDVSFVVGLLGGFKLLCGVSLPVAAWLRRLSELLFSAKLLFGPSVLSVGCGWSVLLATLSVLLCCECVVGVKIGSLRLTKLSIVPFLGGWEDAFPGPLTCLGLRFVMSRSEGCRPSLPGSVDLFLLGSCSVWLVTSHLQS